MRNTDRIQKYLNGNLNEDELKNFRIDLQKDPELVQELDLHRSLKEVVLSQDEKRFRKKLNDAYREYKIDIVNKEIVKNGKRKSNRIKALTYSAILSFCIAGVLLFLAFQKESNKSLFNKYLYPYNTELNNRHFSNDKVESSMLNQGVTFFQQKKYSEATQCFKRFLIENPESTDAQFYNGLCYIYLNDFSGAISSFDFVLHQPFNYYQEYAGWYLAMCYIGANKNATARIILNEIVDSENFFSSKAKKVLRKLR